MKRKPVKTSCSKDLTRIWVHKDFKKMIRMNAASNNMKISEYTATVGKRMSQKNSKKDDYFDMLRI